MQHFANDDASYLNWIAENPNGFVLNVERSPRPEYRKRQNTPTSRCQAAWLMGSFCGERLSAQL